MAQPSLIHGPGPGSGPPNFGEDLQCIGGAKQHYPFWPVELFFIMM